MITCSILHWRVVGISIYLAPGDLNVLEDGKKTGGQGVAVKSLNAARLINCQLSTTATVREGRRNLQQRRCGRLPRYSPTKL